MFVKIKTVSHWLLSKGDVVSSTMRELTNIVQMIDFNNFGKKLHVCYVINDMLHESMKMRESVRNIYFFLSSFATIPPLSRCEHFLFEKV